RVLSALCQPGTRPWPSTLATTLRPPPGSATEPSMWYCSPDDGDAEATPFEAAVGKKRAPARRSTGEPLVRVPREGAPWPRHLSAANLAAPRPPLSRRR